MPNRRPIFIALGVAAALITTIAVWWLIARLDDRPDLPPPSQIATAEATQAIPTREASPTDAVEIALTEAPTPTRTSGTVELASGRFYPVSHDGSGVVSIIELSDGSRILRFDPFVLLVEDELRVVLVAINPVPHTARAEVESGYDLGELYTTRGAQNYEIPAEVDLSLFRSVVIWSVTQRQPLIAAPLTPP